MAKTNTYQPSDEQMELVRRFFNGDRSQELLNALNQLMMTDENFGSYFKRLQTQMKSTQGRGNSWSVGTNGSRMNGDNNQVRFNRGAEQWAQQRNQRAGYAGAPTSPGGFKASGRDADSALRRSGEMTPDVIKSKVKVDFDKGTATLNGQTYSRAQVDAILKRGMSGATMNWKDQAIYDKLIQYGATMDDAKEARMEERRKSAADRDALAAEERQRRQREYAADLQKRNLDFEDWRRKEDYKKQLESKDAEYERLNEKHGLPRGTRLSQKDYDALESGAKVYDHEPQVRDKYERDRMEIEDRFFNKEIDEATYNKALDALDAEYAKTPMRLVDNNSPKTVEQILAGSQNGLYVNGNGDLVAVPDTFENKQEQRRLEAEDKRRQRQEDLAETRRLERNKWVAEQTLKQQAAHEKSRAAAEKAFNARSDVYDGKDEAGNGFAYPDFDEMAERQRLFGLYDATQANAPTDEVVNPAADPKSAVQTEAAPAATEPLGRFEGDWKTLMTPQTPDEMIPFGQCPICNSQLDEYGMCSVCGYPDEAMIEQWKLENGVE